MAAFALVVALVASVAGCATRAYVPGALAATAPIPPDAARTRGCLDLGATIDERDDELRVLYVFGNRCPEPKPLDLSRARVVAHTDDPSEPAEGTPLTAEDPRHEIGPRHLDDEEWGSETVRYRGLPGQAQRVCITFEAEGAAPICIARGERTTEVRDWGWLDARFRGPQTFRTRACNRGAYARESHVVGDAACTRFGDLWSYEGKPPMAVVIGARFTTLPTFASVTSRGAHASGANVRVGELAFGARGFVTPSLYVGGGFSFGAGPAPADVLVVPNDANGSTVGVLTIAGELAGGGRLPLARRVHLEAEVACRAGVAGLIGPTDFADVKHRRFDVDYGVVAVVPRVAVELFVTRAMSLRAFAGADTLHGWAPAFGLEVAQHMRAYGGPPLP